MFIKNITKTVIIFSPLLLLINVMACAQGFPSCLEMLDQSYTEGDIPIPPAEGSTAIVQKIVLSDSGDAGDQDVHIIQIDVDCLGTADGNDIESVRILRGTSHQTEVGSASVSSFPATICSGADLFVIPDDGEDILWVEVTLSGNAIHGRVLQLQTWIWYWEDREDNPRWGFATDGAPETLGGGAPPTAAVFRVTSGGDVLADGAYYGQEFYTGAADIAEWVDVSEPVAPGDVLELDPDHPGYYRKARGRCSTLVAGVVSTNPGFILGSDIPSSSASEHGLWTMDDGHWTSDSALLALIGIIPVKVTDEGGPIRPGDLLVGSSTSGCAMRWEEKSDSPVCSFVGKALEPLTGESGLILVLLMAH